MVKKILIVGGDGRMRALLPLLRVHGCQVTSLGLEEGGHEDADLSGADALLFPYPYAVRQGRVPTLTGLPLFPGQVLAAAKPGAVVLAGKGLEPYLAAEGLAGKKLRFFAYHQHEPFLDQNAAISAEATVYEAMGMTEETLSGMEVLVTGYGRYGRATACRLRLLGAEVWVAARSEKQRLLARSDGMRAIALEDISEVAPGVRMLLNTIPAQVLPKAVLAKLPPGACLLELASPPYGFCLEEAKSLPLRVRLLPALPGKYAPLSAARALKDASLALLKEAEQQ